MIRRAVPLLLALLTGCAAKPAAKPDAPLIQSKPPICALESPELCLQDGIDLWVGNGRDVDHDSAKQKFELACSGGLPRGCTYVGIALKGGDALERARAFDLFGTSCEGGEAMACAQLGTEYLAQAWVKAEQSGQPELAAFVAANDHLRRACELPEADEDRKFWGWSPRGYACGNLAASYEHGFAVPQDHVRALELNRLSCGLDWQRSCAQVGYFYENGLGVDKDTVKAREVYEVACAAKDAMGCNNLAVMLVEEAPDRAAELFAFACKQQFPGSCEQTGELPKEPSKEQQ